ncbi:hypothetical protein X769_33400 [Mesorhizobium sp. LSJC268A00]|nr:hypothetical protein X771_32685 [Mesorhizobium sp. LSJC277A00]ESW63214.1 hypothetical protein X773_33750 [Mesorhizobium sp. LSJC285A00]ESW78776.1 hypothetical protein X770_32215 [Mesorhizobium sp. LSJC269B00]ESW94276.1 hypothetical protein X769_33400 [Mesorhizobium sp. LSJC268A00]ESW94403.1 hypothetical protein X768_34245 [Mesorhizobium sp. LSJC265A00]ESX01709.1 hypothetical protein X767_33725 [Mesorhizobium sp. LSJC264A00]ESZ08035.1 hypothetical protein X736_06515 [Mesorhizobium sp. L2C08
MDKAEEFYTRLFERRPDDRPMDVLIQWRNVAGANLQIFHDKRRMIKSPLTSGDAAGMARACFGGCAGRP